MRLSSKTRYGTRAMIELATAWPNEILSIATISKRQDISRKYLEQIMSLLKKDKLVNSIIGKGYRIARPPSEIHLGRIYQVFESANNLAECKMLNGVCPRSDICPTRTIWDGLHDVILEYLENITLADAVCQWGRTKDLLQGELVGKET